MTLLNLRRLRATSFPGFSPTRSWGRVGENPGNEFGLRDLNRGSEWDFGSEKDFLKWSFFYTCYSYKILRKYIEDIKQWREDMNYIFEWQNNILRTSAASE